MATQGVATVLADSEAEQKIPEESFPKEKLLEKCNGFSFKTKKLVKARGEAQKTSQFKQTSSYTRQILLQPTRQGKMGICSNLLIIWMQRCHLTNRIISIQLLKIIESG